MKHIIDVRSAEEFQYECNPLHTNIPFDELLYLIENDNLPKIDEYIIACRTGNRSGIIVEIMKEIGYMNVTNGGGWNAI